MVDVFDGPFGTYVDVAAICVADAQIDVGLLLISFAALYGITLTCNAATAGSFVLTEGVSSPHPDFDAIRLEQREKMGVELSNIWDAVDAAPVA